MDVLTMAAWCKAGAAAAISLAAVGSAIGTGTAGLAAIGAWKKCFLQSKAAPFLLLIFIGAPLSQTIYGMILMNTMNRAADVSFYLPEGTAEAEGDPLAVLGEVERARWSTVAANWPAFLFAGVLGGIAMAMSAAWQGRAGAAGADALAETGQGFGNYLMTIGVVETVALFVLVFLLTVVQ